MSANPYAFPFLVHLQGDPSIISWHESSFGMSLRDCFAGRVLAGLLAGTPHSEAWPERASAAQLAYQYADAMLDAREAASETVDASAVLIAKLADWIEEDLNDWDGNHNAAHRYDQGRELLRMVREGKQS